MSLTHKPCKVLADVGQRNVPGRVGNSRDGVTVLACINAAGRDIPPLVIIKGLTEKSLRSYGVESGPPGMSYTYQKKAWMEDLLGLKWFEDHFLKHCGPERPQLILLDSHSSHETLGLIEAALASNVHLFVLSPHTTQYLNPLDKTVFGQFQREYNKVCTDFMSKSPSNLVSKWEWPRLFREAYNKSMTKTNITKGFEFCGIFPFDASRIPNRPMAPSMPFDTLPPARLATETAATAEASVSARLATETAATAEASVSARLATETAATAEASVSARLATETAVSAEASVSARLATETVVTAGASASAESATTCTQEHSAVAIAITNTVDIQTVIPSAIFADDMRPRKCEVIGTADENGTADLHVDDPEALLELLTSGRLEITPTEPDLPTSSILTEKPWNTEINNIFNGQVSSNPSSEKKNSSKRKVTSHRLSYIRCNSGTKRKEKEEKDKSKREKENRRLQRLKKAQEKMTNNQNQRQRKRTKKQKK